MDLERAASLDHVRIVLLEIIGAIDDRYQYVYGTFTPESIESEFQRSPPGHAVTP